jgi:DNA end-binding protein Ku
MIPSAKQRTKATSSATTDHPSANNGSVFAPASRGRSSWSGLLRISLVAIPVKAYPAVSSTAASPHFHLLHAGCGQRIGYQKHCPCHGLVDTQAIVRGYEYAPGQHVLVEPEELDKLRPARDRALVLEQFISINEVDPTFLAGRSLYLVPDGAAAQHPYGVFVDALKRAGKGALARVVLSGNRQLVMVRPAGKVLAMDVLHYPAKVRQAAAWEPDLSPGVATPAEQELAARLIALSSGPLDWARYRDTSAEELTALLQAKIADQPPAAPADEPVLVLQLLDALKQSVAAAGNGTRPVDKVRKSRVRRATA